MMGNPQLAIALQNGAVTMNRGHAYRGVGILIFLPVVHQGKT
jgi:hypothetical protein